MKNVGLIGFPLSHSFSKKYFTQKFEKEKIDAKYELYELTDIKQFPSFIHSMEFNGLNVTIPYKEKVIPYLDALDNTAAEIGAVNVIKFTNENGKKSLKGYNTDVIGFSRSIQKHLKSYHKKALILGTGGAGKAIDFALQKMDIEVRFVSRNMKYNNLTYNELNKDILDEYLMIINASPVGMYPKIDECPAIPYEFLSDKHLLFDSVYNPVETLFMKKGKAHGADVMNGEEMLQLQAEAAWKIWNET